jgi:hypothetical protein
MTVAVLGVLLFALALATGCTGDSDNGSLSESGEAATSAPSAASPQPTSDISEDEARSAAEKVLLTLQDFPAGWSQEPPDEDEEPPLDVPPECKAFAGEEDWPGTVVKVESPEFDGPDDEDVNSSAIVYADGEAARLAFAGVRDACGRCRGPFLQALPTYLEQQYQKNAPGVTAEITATAMDWLPFPTYGDEGLSVRMSVTIDLGTRSIDCYLDELGWRVGRVEGDISFSTCSDTPGAEEEQRLAKIILGRLRIAVEDLD